MSWRVGVDVGGTFTDCVAIERETGRQRWAKVPTTPPLFVDGVIASIEALDVPLDQVDTVVHATTIGINAIVERRYPPTALICTEGFRDLLEIRRCRRRDLYNPWWEKPASLVPRYLRIGVPERIDWQGAVLRPLDEEATRAAIRQLRAHGVESYAVATLFSFLDARHERRIEALIGEEHPGAFVSSSADVAPIIREYDRTVTTVLNATLQPIVSRYLEELERRLAGLGIDARLLLMRSSGGVCDVGAARRRPVTLLEGGHAAGARLGALVGAVADAPNAAVYDGGGTTATVALVERGAPVVGARLDLEFDVYAATPAVAVRSIGQGGGAVAWVDRGGALRVGPESAGAEPGPACYGSGGTEPTVTDALVVLGVLDPEWDWIRNRAWDRDASLRALRERVGAHFGWDEVEAASAIFSLAVDNVSVLLREAVVGEGRDPRDLTLVAIGGSGPMLAARLAREQGIGRVLVPAALGTASALGLLLSDLRYDYARSLLAPLRHVDRATLGALLDGLAASGHADLPGVARIDFALDLRYVGEHWEVTVPLATGDGLEPGLAGAALAFHAEHGRLYGFDRPDEPIEVVTVRCTATAPVDASLPLRDVATGDDPVIGRRRTAFEGAFCDTPVLDYDRLGPGAAFSGPAIVHRRDGTMPVPPGWDGAVDAYGNVRLTWSGA